MTAHLEVEAPSSTTINYVVTSKKRQASRLLRIIGHAVRIAVIFHVALLSVVKARQDGYLVKDNITVKTLLSFTFFDAVIELLAHSTEWWLMSVGTLAVAWLCLRRPYAEESLLVLQGMGIQTSTSSPYYFVGPTTTFIPTTSIQDIVIHEAFKGLEVRFYLAVIVEGASDVVVVFPNLLPRLDVLQEVWRGARKCLYAGASKPG